MDRLKALLADEPQASGVTYGDRLPRMYHPHRLVELDDGGMRRHRARSTA